MSTEPYEVADALIELLCCRCPDKDRCHPKAETESYYEMDTLITCLTQWKRITDRPQLPETPNYPVPECAMCDARMPAIDARQLGAEPENAGECEEYCEGPPRTRDVEGQECPFCQRFFIGYSGLLDRKEYITSPGRLILGTCPDCGNRITWGGA